MVIPVVIPNNGKYFNNKNIFIKTNKQTKTLPLLLSVKY